VKLFHNIRYRHNFVNYYSLLAVAQRRVAKDAEISNLIASEYNTSSQQAGDDVMQIVNQFVDEKLLLPHSYDPPPAAPVAEPAQTRDATPQLEIYREMGHLLALDPPMPGLDNIAWDEARPL
jgi:hypothetical protein